MSVHGEEKFAAHIYLDHHYPPAQWNIVRGAFCSPSCLEESKNHGLISISMASMLLNEKPDRLVSELWLEEIRRLNYPENVSRLNGIFVFDDLDSIAQLWENNNWGGHFQDEYLADVGVFANKSSRVDSNWIADIISSDGKLLDGWEKAAHSYWQGNPHPNKKPIWERIIEGHITVWSMRSKLEALKEIEAIWPQALNILRYAELCAGYGSLDGQTFPIILTKEDRIELIYCIRLVQAMDEKFIYSLNEFIEKNPHLNCTIHCKGENTIPDLSGYSRVITPESPGGFGDILKQTLEMRKIQSTSK